jgi:hypothetical protein
MGLEAELTELEHLQLLAALTSRVKRLRDQRRKLVLKYGGEANVKAIDGRIANTLVAYRKLGGTRPL